MKIEKPCTEDFSGMIKNDLGRHCSSCNKTVVNFTKMSNVEIQNHLLKSSGEICGRFKTLQLEQKSGFEKFILNVHEYFFGLKLKPIRVAFLALLSGITAFTSSCMGKVQYDYDDKQEEKNKESTKTAKQDSIQKK